VELVVNGEKTVVPDGLTVRDLIEHLGLSDGPVAVERNREVVPRTTHADVTLAAGDAIEIVHFVGGG
jgi:sulfur carrier protein